ncbi:hypothetical protein V8C86DRAFT_2646778 [Haematococcus lacustris]
MLAARHQCSGCARHWAPHHWKPSIAARSPATYVTGAAGTAPVEPDTLFNQEHLAPYLGPVTVVASPGRGLGLAASKPLVLGELVMVCLPIASLDTCSLPNEEEEEEEQEWEGQEGEEAEEEDGAPPDELVTALAQHMLQQSFSSLDLQWLQALEPAPSPAATSPPAPTPLTTTSATTSPTATTPSCLEPSLSNPSSSNAFTTPGLTSAAGGDREGSPSRPPLPPLCCGAVREDMPKAHPLPAPLALAGGLRLQRLLATHALQVSSEYLDLITADPQDSYPSSEVIGLWPEHALLNHSCVPSTVSYLDRGHLITRITRRGVATGGELFTNFLGDMVMTPLHIRQASLQQRYGFTCTCPRCKAEAKLEPGLQQLIRDIYESCTDQVREELEAAVTEGDEEVLAGLCDQLAAYVEVMDAAFHKTQLSERSQVWVQASLHCLYELLYLVLEALGQERDPQLAPLLQAVASAVQPGSEMACFWARTHLFDAREAEGSQPQRRLGDHQRDRSADRDSLRSSAMAVDKQQLNKLMAAGLSSQAAAVMLATNTMDEVEMQQAPSSLGGHSTRGTSGSGSSRSNSHSSPAPGNAKGQATVGSKASSKANKRHGNSNGSRSGQGFGARQAPVESQHQSAVEEAEELCLRTYLARFGPLPQNVYQAVLQRRYNQERGDGVPGGAGS